MELPEDLEADRAVGRGLLRLLAVVLLSSAAAFAGDGPSSFPVRIIKLGGTFDSPDVRAHLEFSVEHGFNAVWVYSHQAGRWTEAAAPDGPYLEASFLDLARWCRDRDVRIFVSVNPVSDSGGHYVFSKRTGEKRIRRFFSLMKRQAGVRDFVLSFDDQPTALFELSDVLRFGRSSAPAHLELTRRLGRAVPRRGTFWMCASSYSDRHLGDGSGLYSSAFLEGLSVLPESTGLVWTGPRVVSPSITAEDLEATRKRLGGRELLLYDNYPVNDNNGTALALILGPLRERDRRLIEQTSVYLSCPMRELGASRLALMTIADYLMDPAGYDADASWKSAMEALTVDRPEAREALSTQGLEWGGWIGTRNYRPRDDDNVYTAAAALNDPAAMASWTWVARRYPDRMEALEGISDPIFRDELIDRMAARLAVARALPLTAEIKKASADRRGELMEQLDAVREAARDYPEAVRLLDEFLDAAWLGIPASKSER